MRRRYKSCEDGLIYRKSPGDVVHSSATLIGTLLNSLLSQIVLTWQQLRTFRQVDNLQKFISGNRVGRKKDETPPLISGVKGKTKLTGIRPQKDNRETKVCRTVPSK